MKNKIIWSANDIEKQHGILIIRESSPLGSTDIKFARTVTYKIGFSNQVSEKTRYGKISIFTDGWFCPIANTAQEFADYLNNDEYGYRPLTKNEALLLLNDAESQLFLSLP